MKWLLTTVGMLLTTALCAQDFQPDIDKLMAQSKLFKSQPDTVKPRFQPPTLNLNMLGANAIQRKPGVYALPQDGMPCIVPDTKGIVAMPNAARTMNVSPANRIPNAAPKLRTPRSTSGGEDRAADAKR